MTTCCLCLCILHLFFRVVPRINTVQQGVASVFRQRTVNLGIDSGKIIKSIHGAVGYGNGSEWLTTHYQCGMLFTQPDWSHDQGGTDTTFYTVNLSHSSTLRKLSFETTNSTYAPSALSNCQPPQISSFLFRFPAFFILSQLFLKFPPLLDLPQLFFNITQPFLNLTQPILQPINLRLMGYN